MLQGQWFAGNGKIKIGVQLYALPGRGMVYNTRSECIKLLIWRVLLESLWGRVDYFSVFAPRNALVNQLSELNMLTSKINKLHPGLPFMRTIISILACSFLLGCASLVEWTISRHRDWAFMQSVGGITVVGQDKNPDWLIIRADVSGLKEFSNKPTGLNSALAARCAVATVRDAKIQIYVETSLVSEKFRSPEINGVDISGIKKGTYTVQYLNPDNSVVDLKEVVIR